MPFKRKHFARALLELHEADFTVLVFNNILICLWNRKILSNEGSCLEEVVLSRHLPRSQECSTNRPTHANIDWVFLLRSLKYLRCSFCRNYRYDFSINYLTYTNLNVSCILLYPVLTVLYYSESLMRTVDTSVWEDIFYLTCDFIYWILHLHK